MLDWLPPSISSVGTQIDFFFRIIYYISVTVFCLVATAMVYILARYRAGNVKEALYYPGNTKLEIFWTATTIAVMLILSIVSKPLWSKIKQEMPPANIVVQVTGKQFNWQMQYPGPDNIFGTDDDYQIDNSLHVPVNQTVRIILKSRDVIHSFFVPNLRLKQDAIPGREIVIWFEAQKTGEYEIPCAELCGFGHSGMLGRLYVLSDDAYRNWVEETWPDAQREYD